METRNAPKKPSRFQIVKLEERIAPAAVALASAAALGLNYSDAQTAALAQTYNGYWLSEATSYARAY